MLSDTCDAVPVYQLPLWSQELKDKWIAALRSGEFKQCSGVLHDGESHCCLGVLAVICGAPSRPSVQAVGRYLAQTEFFDGRGWRCSLFGGALIGSDYVDRLSTLNDSGHDFYQIANEIEQIPV